MVQVQFHIQTYPNLNQKIISRIQVQFYIHDPTLSNLSEP